MYNSLALDVLVSSQFAAYQFSSSFYYCVHFWCFLFILHLVTSFVPLKIDKQFHCKALIVLSYYHRGHDKFSTQAVLRLYLSVGHDSPQLFKNRTFQKLSRSMLRFLIVSKSIIKMSCFLFRVSLFFFLFFFFMFLSYRYHFTSYYDMKVPLCMSTRFFPPYLYCQIQNVEFFILLYNL